MRPCFNFNSGASRVASAAARAGRRLCCAVQRVSICVPRSNWSGLLPACLLLPVACEKGDRCRGPRPLHLAEADQHGPAGAVPPVRKAAAPCSTVPACKAATRYASGCPGARTGRDGTAKRRGRCERAKRKQKSPYRWRWRCRCRGRIVVGCLACGAAGRIWTEFSHATVALVVSCQCMAT